MASFCAPGSADPATYGVDITGSSHVISIRSTRQSQGAGRCLQIRSSAELWLREHTKKDGAEQLNFTAFYEALLEAKGVSLRADDGDKGRSKGGRKLSYSTKVQFNGNLMVGKAYTAMLNLKPGDTFEIKLGHKQIQLIPVGDSEEE